MPGFNQTGPIGQGPMTGRRMGRCSNYGTDPKNQNSSPSENQENPQNEDFFGRGPGFGWRMGRRGGGMGRGMRNRLRGGF